MRWCFELFMLAVLMVVIVEVGATIAEAGDYRKGIEDVVQHNYLLQVGRQ